MAVPSGGIGYRSKPQNRTEELTKEKITVEVVTEESREASSQEEWRAKHRYNRPLTGQGQIVSDAPIIWKLFGMLDGVADDWTLILGDAFKRAAGFAPGVFPMLLSYLGGSSEADV